MARDSLEIKLVTLTPIWTGGADGKSSTLHLTGIIGSLRWWYEGLVRGVGGHVCTREKPCIYDEKEELYQGLCDVCRVFGTTGWARRFKLIISKENLDLKQPAGSRSGREGNLIFQLSPAHPITRQPPPRWYLPGDALSGSIILAIHSTGSLDKEGKQRFDPAIIAALFQFIADRASLGAKPQLGLGVVRLAKSQSTAPLLQLLQQIVALHEKNKDRRDYHVYDELPSLHNMFFARVRADENSTASATFDLKYDLRAMFRRQYSDPHLRHTIMGSVRGNNRIGAKIMMSYPYEDGIIRIWGWIPAIARSTVTGSEIMDKIYDQLEDEFGDDFYDWQDFNPKKYDSVLRYMEENLLGEAK